MEVMGISGDGRSHGRSKTDAKVTAGGKRYSGYIQAFHPKQGWGFVESRQLGHSDGKGLFFHVKDCDGFEAGVPEKGHPVKFSVGTGISGKEQAKDIHAVEGAFGGSAWGGKHVNKRMMDQFTNELMGAMAGSMPSPYDSYGDSWNMNKRARNWW